MKAIKLDIPVDLYRELEVIAVQMEVKPIEVIRELLKVGLLAYYLEINPDAELIIRENGEERPLIIFGRHEDGET